MRRFALVGMLAAASFSGCTSLLGDFAVGGAAPAISADASPDVAAEAGPGPDAGGIDAGLDGGVTVTAVDIAVGLSHSCAVVEVVAQGVTTRHARCWGDDTVYQLGARLAPGRTARVELPADAAEPASIHSSALSRSTCVVDQRKRVYCFGENDTNQSGAAVVDSASAATLPGSPVRDPTLALPLAVTSFAVGTKHACGVTDPAGTALNARVVCWGDNGELQVSGSLVTGPQAPRAVPFAAAAGANVTAIYAGASTTCSGANGNLYCWGSNAGQQIQAIVNPTDAFVLQPTFIENLRPVVTIGDKFILSANSSRLNGFGDNTYKQSAPNDVAMTVRGAQTTLAFNVQQMSAGFGNVCAHDGATVRCWGKGITGFLTATAPMGIQKLVLGAGHACFLSSGAVYCWGGNASGQVAPGSLTTSFDAPTRVELSAL